MNDFDKHTKGMVRVGCLMATAQIAMAGAILVFIGWVIIKLMAHWGII